MSDDKVLQVQIAMLREGLRQYGQHEDWCHLEDQREIGACRLKGKEPICSCGYDWLLSLPEPPPMPNVWDEDDE